MTASRDPYWKLEPPAATPVEDLCACEDSPPIVLQPHLSSNPLACVACNGEVPPERVGFSEELAERLASWQSFYNCFYLLWLDSAEYEDWARSQLEDSSSPVNCRALALVAELRSHRPGYYWWFVGEDAVTAPPVTACPVCKAMLTRSYGHLVCEDCGVLVPGDSAPVRSRRESGSSTSHVEE